MKERGILFSAPMVKALLTGTKTQTRRIVKLEEFQRSKTKGCDWTFRGRGAVWQDYRDDRIAEKSPYGVVGDRLWVRESWNAIGGDDEDANWQAAPKIPTSRGPHGATIAEAGRCRMTDACTAHQEASTP